MQALDVVQKVRSGTIGQFEIQRDEINAVCVEDSEGCACIVRGENVEILPEDLCESRAGSGIIVDNQDCWFRGTCIGDKSRRHRVLVSLSPLSVNEISRTPQIGFSGLSRLFG